MSDINNFNNKIEQLLAPYAAKSDSSKGRIHNEPEHPYRSRYQRDRERILHTTAFRRLEYKTQVFVNHEGDHYRTRLTHTLEVAQIARTIARALSLNEDLVEAIALAHDLGHTPFGHTGEEVLSELMKDHGGFEHNLQSLRVVDILEERYPDFQGLNLTWEVREGIVRHNTLYDKPNLIQEFNEYKSPTLEAQVVNIADEIAYDSHDLDDGLASKIISEKDLLGIGLCNKVMSQITQAYPDMNFHKRRYQIVRMIIGTHATDVIEQSLRNIEALSIGSIEDVRSTQKKIIDFSASTSAERAPLREFLLKSFYQNHRVMRMADKAGRFIRELFGVYISSLGSLPPFYQEKAKKEDAHRVVCDYIAGMTDRYALDEYKKLFEPYERV